MKTLKPNDRVVFVVQNYKLEYAVENTHLSIKFSGISPYKDNDAIFQLLGIDKYGFASNAYGYKVDSGMWPSFHIHDYEAATRLVEQLQILCNRKEPLNSKYKVGDKVTIAIRDGEGQDYPFNFSDEMAKLAGKEYIIESVTFIRANDYRGRRYYEEPFNYRLSGLKFVWSSLMFKPLCINDADNLDDITSSPSKETKLSTSEVKKVFTIDITECEISLNLKSTNKYHF